MIPEIETLKAKHLPDALADAALKFIETGDPSIPRNFGATQYSWEANSIGASLIQDLPWNENTRQLLKFFIYLSDGTPQGGGTQHEYLVGVFRQLLDAETSVDSFISDEILSEVESLHGTLLSFVENFLTSYTGNEDWQLAEAMDSKNPFIRPVANLLFRSITPAHAKHPELFTNHQGLLSALAIHLPEVARAWCLKSSTFESWERREGWPAILDATNQFDPLCLSFAEAVAATDADDAFAVVKHLNEVRNGVHLEHLVRYAEMPKAAIGHDGFGVLIEHREPEIIGILTRAFAVENAGYHASNLDGPDYQRLFLLITSRWEEGGEGLLLNLLSNFHPWAFTEFLSTHLPSLEPQYQPTMRSGIHRFLNRQSSADKVATWKLVAAAHPEPFVADFEEMLVGKSKRLREIAADALAKSKGKSALEEAYQLLFSKRPDTRSGAVALIESIGDPASVNRLRAALDVEESEAVRAALHHALKALGSAEESTKSSSEGSTFDLDAYVAKQAKGLKLPSSAWLDLSKLPPLTTDSGRIMADSAVALLIVKQSKQKGIEVSPDLVPLLQRIDRSQSAPFASALVEGFLNSEQAASDRWALTLGGLLGDNRVITLLLPRINDWCENSRHKLAEYAAQAISLLPGNEPLMVLDTLSNRYRIKFKNVGKACAEAFNAAAAARGITTDELGDLVVPDFGFDSEGVRRFDWNGGGASAELGADFKLTWFDPETDKAWKALPASAPEEIKTEVKTLTKLLREAVKGQTARLEMTLVRQRRWPVARWRELFENHPLLRSFASNLVWGVYDGGGILLRTFRRYPNGLLADAAGTLEELPESDTTVGMVHPLELVAAALDAWRAHLTRFKVKAPFPQIDRPVELLDPLHGNRRSITLTDKKPVSAGTFRSRAEKRGWNRGSVVDAGGISSYYKLYPGAGVEVILPTANFWIGCDPMETIELCPAYFVKAESVERGSYVYNEPGSDDPRVMRFDSVPAVVWSETLSDLKAIVATKE